jgi:hypothetical protein
MLGWIRIEPYTKIYEIAIQEGVIDKNMDLLPESEKQLPILFYTNPSLKYLDIIAKVILAVMEKIVKPVFKLFRSAIKIII